MNYLSVVYLFIAFTIIIYLKGWKKGLILGIITLILMILLSWAEDILFNNSSVITVIVLFIISFLYEYIEKYIKQKILVKHLSASQISVVRRFQMLEQTWKIIPYISTAKNKILRKELKHKKRIFIIKREP